MERWLIHMLLKLKRIQRSVATLKSVENTLYWQNLKAEALEILPLLPIWAICTRNSLYSQNVITLILVFFYILFNFLFILEIFWLILVISTVLEIFWLYFQSISTLLSKYFNLILVISTLFSKYFDFIVIIFQLYSCNFNFILKILRL